MSNHVYRVTEVVGSSSEGIEDAIRRAVATTARSVRHIDWFEATEIRGHVVDGAVGHFQVTVRVGFRVEETE
jgi:flavin-binding protein dodecin